MSVATAPTWGDGGSASGVRPALGRLTAVELRKMTDTRAGFWLQLAVVAIVLLTVVVSVLTGHDADHTLLAVFENAVQPAAILLPIVGILLVSSEFSQRTALITFTLVPQRWRVLGAKVAASLVLSVVAVLLCLAASALAVAISAPAGPHAWSLPLDRLGQVLVFVATAMVIGVGFGAVLLASAPAIVLYFVAPTAWAALGTISALRGAARWLDQSHALSPLTDHGLDGKEWARAATTLALWMVLPILVGLWRLLRAEVR